MSPPSSRFVFCAASHLQRATAAVRGNARLAIGARAEQERRFGPGTTPVTACTIVSTATSTWVWRWRRVRLSRASCARAARQRSLFLDRRRVPGWSDQGRRSLRTVAVRHGHRSAPAVRAALGQGATRPARVCSTSRSTRCRCPWGRSGRRVPPRQRKPAAASMRSSASAFRCCDRRGPWLEARGVLRYPDRASREEAVIVALSWHGLRDHALQPELRLVAGA